MTACVQWLHSKQHSHMFAQARLKRPRVSPLRISHWLLQPGALQSKNIFLPRRHKCFYVKLSCFIPRHPAFATFESGFSCCY